MVRAGTLWAVKIMGRVPENVRPYSALAFAHPARRFSAKALASRGWSCHSSTKSRVKGRALPPVTALR